MRKPFLVALTALALVGCGGGGGGDTPPPAAGVCQLDDDGEKAPGYPFDLAKFRSDILSDLQTSCGSSGCHAAPNGAGSYSVWAANDKTCPDIQSFKAFISKVNNGQVLPANTILIKNLNGQDPHSPSFAGQGILTEIEAFVQAAYDELNPGEDQTILFSKDVFASKVQPALDASGCSGAVGCHGQLPAGTAGLLINPSPANPSAELDQNFEALTKTKLIDQTLLDAADTRLVFKANDGHGTRLNAAGLAALDAWIQAGLDVANEDPGGTPILCADKGQFNIGVFEEEIRPMLEGERDYNDLDGGSVRTGCARETCHQDPSFAGAGKFYLKPGGTTEELINSFRCFVNPENPANSQVLLCPLNLSGCRSGARHPGEDIFEDVFDLNYQKLLSYIYGSQAGASPLDFAFFAKKINPIFSDPLQCAETQTACADAGCHEREFNGDASGGSNYALERDAVEIEELQSNFIASANFVLFQQPDQSSLVLYPTNEIEDVDNNVLATGDRHPGGVCFDINSQQVTDILKFAGGIRPNGEGFLQDFLVAGVFPANNVADNDIAGFDEETIAPTIFEESGQSPEFNSGEWDGLFSDVADVNLFDAFPAAVGGQNQLAYAVAYMINTTGNNLQVSVTATSENDLELFVDDNSDIGLAGSEASVTVTLPPFEESKAPTRILLKVLQKAGQDFSFTMNFTDQNGVALTDDSQELVFVLSGSNGGI